MEREIIHKEQKQRFELVESGLKAYLEYELSDGKLDLAHTYVPQQLEGKGIASVLMKYALDFARENHLKIKPTCTFADIYMERHPEYKDLL